jgi:hypothetical protein
MCIFDDTYKKEVKRLNNVLDFLESKCEGISIIDKTRRSERLDGMNEMARLLLDAIKHDRKYFEKDEV